MSDQLKHKHKTAMPCVGFETMILASERAKTVHASDRSATVTGNGLILLKIMSGWFRVFQIVEKLIKN
jgi:hypothetical protein